MRVDDYSLKSYCFLHTAAVHDTSSECYEPCSFCRVNILIHNIVQVFFYVFYL